MKYNLSDVCSRLSSGKNIKASEISSEGEYPVFGGNGQRGFTNHLTLTVSAQLSAAKAHSAGMFGTFRARRI